MVPWFFGTWKSLNEFVLLLFLLEWRVNDFWGLIKGLSDRISKTFYLSSFQYLETNIQWGHTWYVQTAVGSGVVGVEFKTNSPKKHKENRNCLFMWFFNEVNPQPHQLHSLRVSQICPFLANRGSCSSVSTYIYLFNLLGISPPETPPLLFIALSVFSD